MNFHDWLGEYADQVASWLADDLELRGKVAAKLRVAFTHVAQRQRLASGTLRHTKAIDWDSVPLGSETDAVLAKRLNRHPSCVAAQRIKRGIPACGVRGRPRKKVES